MSDGMTLEEAKRYFQNITAFADERDKKACEIAILAIAALEAEPMRWIPITYRPMTDDEKRDYAERTGYDEEDLSDMVACPLPDDMETVLVTDSAGNVVVDTFYDDCDGCYFECNCDMYDVKAWMPLPKPYKEEQDDLK